MMAVNLSIPTLTKYLKSALITVLIGLGIIIGYIIYLAQDLPSLDQLENYDPDLVTRIYSADGLVRKTVDFIIIGVLILEVSSEQ